MVDHENLDFLADLIRQDHPSLGTLPLAPDGKYQLRPLTLDVLQGEVVEDLRASWAGLEEGGLPFLFCGWGKARVGSTALNNLFGLAGLPSYYQPVKALLRHRLSASRGTPWRLPSASTHGQLFSKEVGGPYLLAECLFNPLQMLVEAGYPPGRLHLVLLDRDPADCLTSWYDKWSDRVPRQRLLRHHVLASLNLGRIELFAHRHGIPVTHYAYEFSRDPVAAIRALFRRLGLAGRFAAGHVTDWMEHGDLDTDHAKVIYPDEPPAYSVTALHGADTAYRYHRRDRTALEPAELELLERHGVFELHRRSVEACVADLDLDPALAV